MGWDWGNLIDPDKWASGISQAFGVGSGDPSNQDRNELRQNAGQAGAFGQQLAGNYAANQGGINQSIDALRALANGQNSVSAEQLRQGLQQQLAAQQSMAAGASPQNAAMAARVAMNNMNRAAYGMAGQQALAGLQERNQAQQALGQLQLGQSGQNLQGALGGFGAANQGYGYAVQNPQKTAGDLLMKAIAGGGNAAGMAAASDRRLKTDVKDGDRDAAKALQGMKSYSFRYKDEKYGAGKQTGVMAQDLEKAGLGHAVIDTPAGKMVDGAKAATTGLALLASLGKRVDKLEGGKK